MSGPISCDDILNCDDDVYDVATHAPGPSGELPLAPDFLTHAPSGDLFGLIQDVGMGWEPSQVTADAFLLLSHQGGMRGTDGKPIAMGYHVGHYELGLLLEAAAREFTALGCMPFAGYCTDPCDGRTQGTPGMMDSLAYRNEAAGIFRRLIRSLPGRKGVLGIATCDKSLPAMMMALASMHDLPVAIVPGGVTLPPEPGRGPRDRPIHRRPLRPGRGHARTCQRDDLPRLRRRRRRLPVPRHRRHKPGGRGGPRTDAAARGAGPFRPDDLAGSRPTIRPRRSPAPSAEAAGRSHPVERLDPQRDGDLRGLRWIDQSVAPHPGHRPRRGPRPPHRRRLERGESKHPTARGRPAQRPGRSSDGASLPRGRRARGHAAPAGTRPARSGRAHGLRRTPRGDARLVGAIGPSPATARDPLSRGTGSIPTT